MRKTLTSADEVIDALGGTFAVTRLLELNSHKAVSNWRTRGLPARTFLRLTAELANRGLKASPSLWGIAEAGRSNGRSARA